MSVVPCAIRPQVAAGSSFTTGVTFRLGRVKKRRLSKACRNRLCSFDWRGCSDHGAVGDGVSGCHGDLDLPVRAAGKNSTSCFDPHHCRASPAILDRRFTLEAGLSPVVDVSFPGDVVVRHAVVRQADNRLLPAAPPQLAGIVGKWLSDAFDVLEQPDLSADELADPDRRGTRSRRHQPHYGRCTLSNRTSKAGFDMPSIIDAS
jgi:hypothetical protein